MTPLYKRACAALLTCSCLAWTGYAPMAQAEGMGQYVEDSVITTKVKAAIAKDLDRKIADIKVATTQGRVMLSGTAATQAEIDRAEQIAKRVDGVMSVQNDVHLK